MPTLVRLGTTLDAERPESGVQRDRRTPRGPADVDQADRRRSGPGSPAPRRDRADRGRLALPAGGEPPRSEADRILAELAGRPFDLGGDVLLRAGLVHLDRDQDLLLVVFHHAASDHASSSVLFAELDRLYRALGEGVEPELPELPIQYADFARVAARAARRQSPRRAARVLDRAARGRAGTARAARPTGHGPAFRATGAGCASSTFAPELVEPLRELRARQKVSLFMVLLAAFKTLLHRYTGVEDIVVGTPVFGPPPRGDWQPLLGYFSNTLALRTDLSGDPTFAELLRRVRDDDARRRRPTRSCRSRSSSKC